MKTIDYINFTIDHLFSKNNDRQVLKAFFYRITLNLTPREVGKELGLSKSQVNLLTRSVDSYRLNREEFNEGYLKAKEAIENYVTYKQSRNHVRHVRSVGNRLSFNHKMLIQKQEKC